MIKAAVFDLDDTLISEKKYIESGFRHISSVFSIRYGLNQGEVYRLLLVEFEKNRKNVFNRVLETFGVDYSETDIMNFVSQYRKHFPDIEYYEDVLPMIRSLRDMGIRVGMITDGYLDTQKNKLKALNSELLFDKVILTEELGREYWKPHLKSFQMMSEYFDVRYEEMIYVGDNPEKDFYIHEVVPITTIRIVRRDSLYKDKSYLNGVEEDMRIESLSEIISAIKEL